VPQQLGEAGIETATLQAFLTRTTNQVPSERRHFYFLDESSLASTNQMREFLHRLGPRDRVLLIGDTRQHQGVEAGRPFEQLQQAGMRTSHLDEIVRQKDPALKSAVELLAKGDISSALESLYRQGRVREIPDAGDRAREIARSYVESPDRTLIVSPDNASRRQLNVAVREELKTACALGSEEHILKVLVPRQEMTGAERQWASQYETGDVIRYTRGSKHMGIEAGSYATVVRINPFSNELSVEQPSGNIVTYDARRLAGITVYRNIEREFAVGDRIQFTAPDKSLGVANRDMAVIDSFTPGGQICVRLDGSCRVEFDAAAHRHFDHGYAVTSHTAQGLTLNGFSSTPIPEFIRICSIRAPGTLPSHERAIA
jgi:ATP-dependent exoDNAse (exonuclease V) alpha subunit